MTGLFCGFIRGLIRGKLVSSTRLRGLGAGRCAGGLFRTASCPTVTGDEASGVNGSLRGECETGTVGFGKASVCMSARFFSSSESTMVS